MKNTASIEQLTDRIKFLEQQNAKLIQQVKKSKESSPSISQERDKKYHAIWNQAPVGIATIDSQSGRFVEINSAYCDILGYNKPEILEMDFMQVTHPEDLQEDLDNMERLRSGKITFFKMQKRYVRKNGETVWVNLTVVPLWVEGTGPHFHIAIVDNITDIKMYEKIEKRFQDMAEKIPGMVFQYAINENGDFSIPYVSSKVQKYTGYSPDEIYENPSLFLKPIHPDDREFVDQEIQRSAKNLSEFSLVHRLVNTEGKLMWFHVRSIPSRLGTGDIIWDGLSIDISDQTQAENDLRHSEELFRTIFNQAAVGIGQITPDGKFVQVNSKFAEITGYSIDELTHMSFDKITYQEDLNKENKLIDRVMKGEIDCFKIEKRYLHKSGHPIWIELYSNVVRDEKENIQYAVASVIDITERKKIENELKSRVHDQDVILNNVPVYIYFKDTQNNILRISQSVSKITGLPKKEIEGRNSSEIYPKMAERYWADDLEVIASKKPKIGIVEPLPVGNDETRWLMTDKIPVFGDDCEVIGVIVMASDITERINTENQLIESEKKFRTLIESGPIAIFMLRDGKYIYGNPAAARMLGYETPEDIVGVSALQTVAPEFHKTIKQRMEKIDEGKSNEPIELKFVKRNGNVIWTLSTSVSVTMEGKPTAIIMGQDITELRKTRQELNNAQTIQIALAEYLPAGMMLVDASTRRIESVNVYAASLFGADMNEIVGHTCHKFICPASEGECPICDLGQKIDNAEREIVLKNGDRLPVLKSVVSITLDKKQKLLEYFVDISDRKEAELELQESEEKYRKLVTTAPYGIQLTDRKGKIIFSNPAHHSIQGYADGELVGKYIWELMADDTHRSEAKAFYQKIIKEQPRPEVYNNRDLTKDGREIEVQVNWDYIRNTKGELEGIISIISDITKQKALEANVRQAQKMESIGSLAGGIAHDFNNLLFPIVGFSEMMLNDFPPGSPEHHDAQQIFKAGNRGRELVQQILSFSRQSDYQLIPVHIQKILKEVLKLCRATIPADIPITQDIMADCAPVMADPTQIHQIAMNLITNAYHAVEPTGGRINVALKEIDLCHEEDPDVLLASGRYAILSVTDTGTGIDPAVMNRIFDPYFTTKEKGRGTGLGLATVYGIVKAHGGDIRVTSDIGKGAAFNVYLPLLEKAQDSEPEKEKTPLPTGTGHIMLVDDEKSIVHLEKQMLKRLGYRASGFTSAAGMPWQRSKQSHHCLTLS
jgi:PAS domain S-box-containing protein